MTQIEPLTTALTIHYRMRLLKYVLGFACATASVVTQAQVLLIIDASDPAAVTFTATTANSGASATIGNHIGFTLVNFYTANANFQQGPIGGDLTVSEGGQTVSRVWPEGPVTEPPANRGLNFNAQTFPDETWTFVEDQRALSGSVTLNISGEATLPSNGLSGNIQVGREDNGGLGAAIGTWVVQNSITPVPEPASVSVAAGLALGAFAFLRRRRRTEPSHAIL